MVIEVPSRGLEGFLQKYLETATAVGIPKAVRAHPAAMRGLPRAAVVIEAAIEIVKRATAVICFAFDCRQFLGGWACGDPTRAIWLRKLDIQKL